MMILILYKIGCVNILIFSLLYFTTNSVCCLKLKNGQIHRWNAYMGNAVTAKMICIFVHLVLKYTQLCHTTQDKRPAFSLSHHNACFLFHLTVNLTHSAYTRTVLIGWIVLSMGTVLGNAVQWGCLSVSLIPTPSSCPLLAHEQTDCVSLCYFSLLCTLLYRGVIPN